MRIFVNSDVTTDANTDLIFTQMRQNQARAQLPLDVRNYGVTIQESRASPLMILALYSPKGTCDGIKVVVKQERMWVSLSLIPVDFSHRSDRLLPE